jgi:hypothetical protein
MTTPGAHIRGNGISGDKDKLNKKAKKILEVIKNAPHAVTAMKIKEETHFEKEDIDRQLLLLIENRLILLMRDQEGVKIYINPEMRFIIDKLIGGEDFEQKQILKKIDRNLLFS